MPARLLQRVERARLVLNRFLDVVVKRQVPQRAGGPEHGFVPLVLALVQAPDEHR